MKVNLIQVFAFMVFLFGGQFELKMFQSVKRFNKNHFFGGSTCGRPVPGKPVRVKSEDFCDAALVVLGHGTEQNADSAAPVFQHAAELRRRKIFGEVREAFWKQEPQIKKVLAEISAPRVFIVPLFISEGYFASEVIPRELGFARQLKT